MGDRGLKRVRRRALRSAGAAVGSAVLWTATRLVRVRVAGEERRRALVAEHGAVIYAIWHGRFMLAAGRLGYTGAGVLVSLSEDGEIIARASERLGYFAIRGSSSRGGREGLDAMHRSLDAGRSVALTPDGPRGPRHVARPGVAVLAARSGKPVLPLGAAARPAWHTRSWDAFQIAKPFSRGAIAFGEPLFVPDGEPIEPWLERVADALHAAERAAEGMLDR